MKTVDKIILGTVQFGLKYGINNLSGKPNQVEINKILDTAYFNGIRYLDTAEAYGNAIDIIGLYHNSSNNRFKMLSKFKKVNSDKLYDNAKSSLHALMVPNYDTYSYHSFEEYSEFKELKQQLLKLQADKIINRIGISVYSNEQFNEAIDDKDINVIQIPFNILDNENLRHELLIKAKDNNKEIHVRSVFLQGLFFMNVDNLPEKLKPLRKYLLKINEFCKENSTNIDSLALNYVLQNKYIDKVLIGVDNHNQLISNINSINECNDYASFINESINVNEKDLLNPVNWK